MFIKLANLGQASGAFGASLARSKTQKRSLGSPLGRVAPARLGSKAMRGNLINRGQERCVDTSYRAGVSLSHPTYCVMPVLRGFCDGPMARSLHVAKRKREFLGCMERAIGALRAVHS
jgi:hypothetical protein